jgi:hypothetical protein
MTVEVTPSFRSSIASQLQRAKNKTTFSRYCSGEVLKVGRNEEIMYTGTLIDDLIKTVEHAEKCSERLLSSEEKLAHFYRMAQFEMAHFESRFAGVN